MVYVAPSPHQAEAISRSWRPNIAAIAAIGSLAFGMNSETAQAPDLSVSESDLLRARTSLTAAKTDLNVLAATKSATRLRTPWPVLPRLIIDYANRPNGYATGNLTEKDKFIDSGIAVQSLGENWSLGLMIHHDMPADRDCGWIRTDEVRQINVRRRPDVCAGTADKVQPRSAIGREYNCPPHACDDGTYFTRLKPKSDNSLYLNYYRSGKKAYGKLPSADFEDGYHYRYTTKDSLQAVGRAVIERANHPKGKAEVSVWGFTPRRYVPGQPRGGPVKKP